MEDRGGQRLLRRNAGAVFVARVVSAVALTASVAIAAHRLDVADFGLVVSTMAAGFLVNALITFGTDTLVTRSIAAGDADASALARGSLRAQTLAATLVIVAAAGAWQLGAPGVLLVEALSLIPLAVVTIAGAVVRGVERMHHVFTAAVAGSAVTLVGTIVGFAVTTHAVVPIASRLAGAVVTAAVLAVAARPHVEPAPPTRLTTLVGRAAPFAGMVVLAALGAQAGLLIVEAFADEPTGGYGAAIRLSEAARLLPASVVAALFPAMMRGIHRTPDYRRSAKLLGLYAITAMIGLVALAEPIDRLVFDRQPGGPTLIRIVALALPLTVVRLVVSFEAIAEGRERQVLMSAAAGCAVLVIVGMVVAPSLGAEGVAWAQVAGVATAVAVLLIDRALRPASTESMASPAPVGSGEPDRGDG